MDFKVKSSIAVDVATHIFNFYLPRIPMITSIIEKSKNHDIVGALECILTYHRPLKGHCMASRQVRNSVAWFFFCHRGQFSLISSKSVVSYFISVDGQTNSEIC